jgi:hypothetical protein
VVSVAGFLFSAPASAQVDDSARSFHVFPQVADGRVADNSVYQSWLLVTNASSFVNGCAYDLYGMAANRIDPIVPSLAISGSRATFSLPGTAAYAVIPTTGVFPLATGYATLSCAGPVTAQVLYIHQGGQHQNGQSRTLGMSAVYSAQRGSIVQYPVIEGPSADFALAIAYHGFGSARCDVRLADTAGRTVGFRTVTITGGTNWARFLGEAMTVPSAPFLGSVGITCNAGVHTMALLYQGDVFAAVPATVFRD